MIKYNLTNDIIFKTFFKNKKLFLKLIIDELINLNINEDKIEFVYNELLTSPEDKASLLDLRVELENGNIIIIEMQNLPHVELSERFQYYLNKMSAVDLKRGKLYDKLNTVYGIFFLDFEHEEFNDFIGRYKYYDKFLDKELKQCITQPIIINLHYIDDYKKYDISENLLNFLKFMKCKNESEMLVMAQSDKNIKEAYEELKKLNEDPELAAYSMYAEKQEMIQAQRIEDGKNQGISETKKEIIKNLLKKDISYNEISEIVNIPVKDIEKYL